jgi:hypothetical protein
MSKLIPIGSYLPRNDGCWIWQGNITADGYSRFNEGKKARKAHRVIYELKFGPVPVGFELHHTCGVRSCVNPDHLRALSKGDHAKAHWKTHCKHGHELSGENIYVRSNGSRVCRRCNNQHKP